MERTGRWFSMFQFTECLQKWSSSTVEEKQFADGSFMLVLHTRTELGQRSFQVAAPTVWNSLPVHLRSTLISRRQFRDGLKSHLFTGAYFWSSENICFKSVIYLLTYLLTFIVLWLMILRGWASPAGSAFTWWVTWWESFRCMALYRVTYSLLYFTQRSQVQCSPWSTASSFEQLANLLSAQVNSASYSPRDRK